MSALFYGWSQTQWAWAAQWWLDRGAGDLDGVFPEILYDRWSISNQGDPGPPTILRIDKFGRPIPPAPSKEASDYAWKIMTYRVTRVIE